MAQNPLGVTVAGSALACQGVLHNWLNGTHPRFVVVADIGQGNCNVVFGDDGRPVIYFDMGGGTRGSLYTRPAPEPTFCLDVAHSLFIVSHWDDDHYALLDAHLLAGNLAGLECLAPTQTSPQTKKRSVTAGYLAGDIGATGELHLWRDVDPAAPVGPFIATDGEYSVIKVTEYDVNNTGLALRLQNPANPAQFILLTGDATFERYLPNNPMVNRQTFLHGCNLQCVGMVAGHHGSEIGAQGDIPAPPPGVASHLIAYSFGWGNQFAHPTAAGIAAYEARGWRDDHRMDTGGAELAARYAGPRGNVGLIWPGAPPGPAKAPPGALPAQADAAAVALLAATAAEVQMSRPALAGRERIAAGAAYQAARESGAGSVAASLLAAASAPNLAAVAGLALPVHGELTSALGVAVAMAGLLQPALMQQMITAIVDCVALAAACAAREVAADVRNCIDNENGTSSEAAAAAYNGANAPERLAVIGAALPDDIVQLAVNAAAAVGPNAPAVPALRAAVAAAVGAAVQGRIGQPGGGNPSEQPWRAAATAAAAIAGIARDDVAVAIAAAAGVTPAVPIDPAVAVPATLVDNANAKLVERVAAAAAVAGPAIVLPVTRADVASAAAAAARTGFAAAQGAPQVGCHRHPRTCANPPCSLSVHYFHGMFPVRIGTVAGSAAVAHGGDGGAATAAGLADPRHVLVDRGFARYVSDAGAHRIRRFGTDGIIATLAGTVAGAGYGGDANGPAAAAQFDGLSAVALDRFRNQLYVADAVRNRVRRVDLSCGQVTAVAGTGVAGHGGDGWPATAAQLNAPRGLAYDDTSHALFIADTGSHCVRRVDLASGVITTVAGVAGVIGDGPDGPGPGCHLDSPRGLACAGGSLFIADTGNHRVRELRFGQAASIAGTGMQAFGGDGGAATAADLDGPWGVAVGTDLNGDRSIVIADTGNDRVREIDVNGDIGTLAGPAGLAHPVAVACDDAGDVYIAYDAAHCVRRYDRTAGGIPAVFAGTPNAAGPGGDGAAATAGHLSGPVSLACGPGLLFAADAGNRRIRSVQLGGPHHLAAVAGTGHQGDAGDAVQIAANAQLNAPGGFGYDPVAHALYVADSANHCVRRIDLATGIIFRVAGQPLAGAGPGGDGGPAIAAQLSNPSDVHFDGVENVLYIADTGNNKIRAVSLATGVITTLAGTGGGAWAGDGAGAAAAQLNGPLSVTADANGIVFAGTSDHRVRRIALDVPRTITTWAGSGAPGAGGDGLPVANPAVTLNVPAGLAADNSGNLYISCAGSSSVRLVRWDGSLITTIAGAPPAGFGGDGGPPEQANLNGPRGIWVDEAGRNLFIADALNHRVRRACL